MGHGLGAAAHSWLGLDRGAHCSRCSGARLQADGAMQRHAVDEVVDWDEIMFIALIIFAMATLSFTFVSIRLFGNSK